MQYTIRGIPVEIDAALRQRARAAGKSLNEVAIEALAEGAGVTSAPRQRRNLDDIADLERRQSVRRSNRRSRSD